MHAKQNWFLAGLLGIVMLGYMVLGARGEWNFILPFRGAKLAALILVGTAVSTATVLFQTITHNRILTPSVMGFDALYVLIVTLSVFFLGGQGFMDVPDTARFLISLVVLIAGALFLFGTLLFQQQEDLLRLVLSGIILAILFRSLTNFVVRMIDPNEFAVIQVSSYARFNRIETDLLGLSAVLIGAVLVVVWRMRHRLDVLALGRAAAINLGENPRRGSLQILVLISILVATSTTFVGPVAFLGLLVVSLAHLLTPGGGHGVLLISSGLISCLVLVGGQTFLERVLGLSTPLSVIVDFVGGLLFLFLVLKGVRR